jgi:hypothetical protein
MIEEGEREQQDEDGGEAEAAFDENPPVNPGRAQVGNSKARFFMPREGEQGEGEDEADEGENEDETDGSEEENKADGSEEEGKADEKR